MGKTGREVHRSSHIGPVRLTVLLLLGGGVG